MSDQIAVDNLKYRTAETKIGKRQTALTVRGHVVW